MIITARLTAFGKVIEEVTITIGNNKVYPILPNDTLIVGTIIFSKNSTLQNNGTLIFKDANGISDFSINTSSNGNQGNISIFNYGKIECKNCNIKNPDQGSLIFKNDGLIKCENNFTATIDDKTTYTSLCDSKTEAQNITFQGLAGLTYNGTYKATNKCTIDITEGAPSIVNIGNNCGDSKFEAEELLLKNNVTQINIKEQAQIDSLDISGVSTSANIQVDDILTLGKITTGGKSLFLTGITKSIMSLCYNPTGGKDFLSSSSAGTVIYLQSDNISNAWQNTHTPISEADLSSVFNIKKDDLSKSFDECINGLNFATLLPIKLTSFTVQGSEDDINLEWEVASEKDLDNYSVE